MNFLNLLDVCLPTNQVVVFLNGAVIGFDSCKKLRDVFSYSILSLLVSSVQSFDSTLFVFLVNK